MLESIQAVLPAVGNKKLSEYFLIRDRMIHAFNGEQVLTSPIACDLDCAPKAKAFLRVIKKYKNDLIAMWLDPEGNLLINAGEHFETVKCEDVNKFPNPIPLGFWFDQPKPRKPPKPKAVPPDPVWLHPDYLPGLEEARAFAPILMTVEEVISAVMAGEPFVCDTEVFKNYFLVAFASVVSGKILYFEMRQNDDGIYEGIDLERLKWVIEHALIITFFGNKFDIPIIALALAGKTCAELKQAANKLIEEELKPWQVLKSAKIKKLTINHIDLFEVCPLDGSLKLYGGRLHVPRIQDLPFAHDAILSEDQICIVRHYCIGSDLTATAFCYVNLREQIDIRQVMSDRYGQDLRSKSDAQIAQAVINGEIRRLSFAEPEVPHVEPGTSYKYIAPVFIRFQTPMLNRILEKIQSWNFTVSKTGYIQLPIDPDTGEQTELKVTIADAVYTMGMGGLHSCESTVSHKADSETVICDRDVASYYPQIILNLELFPQHLGRPFLQVFRALVKRRLEAKEAAKEAKAAGNKELEFVKKAEAETLKIVVNGTFGKTSDRWSTLYSPDLTMRITLTGQLGMLMLIERLELAGITVCSANTDGITFKCPTARKAEADAFFAAWEKETGFVTEETLYSAIYSRDVNDYIALKTDGKTKAKGAFFNPWSSLEYKYERFKKNPQNAICIEAIVELLTKGIPIQQTIRSATDIRKFVSVRRVVGGGVKNGFYIGKVVRWYYKKGETGCIVYAKSGNKVPESDGAWPCMVLPEKLPEDLDFEWYENETLKSLQEVSAVV